MEKTTENLFTSITFYLALFLPIVCGSLLAVFFGCNDRLDWSFTSTGVNYAVTIFKVPLAISALAFPLVAFVIANHRSIQATEQIRHSMKQLAASESQNKLANKLKDDEAYLKLAKDNFNEIDELMLYSHNSNPTADHPSNRVWISPQYPENRNWVRAAGVILHLTKLRAKINTELYKNDFDFYQKKLGLKLMSHLVDKNYSSLSPEYFFGDENWENQSENGKATLKDLFLETKHGLAKVYTHSTNKLFPRVNSKLIDPKSVLIFYEFFGHLSEEITTANFYAKYIKIKDISDITDIGLPFSEFLTDEFSEGAKLYLEFRSTHRIVENSEGELVVENKRS
jgi:hypothetical protein